MHVSFYQASVILCVHMLQSYFVFTCCSHILFTFYSHILVVSIRWQQSPLTFNKSISVAYSSIRFHYLFLQLFSLCVKLKQLFVVKPSITTVWASLFGLKLHSVCYSEVITFFAHSQITTFASIVVSKASAVSTLDCCLRETTLSWVQYHFRAQL